MRILFNAASAISFLMFLALSQGFAHRPEYSPFPRSGEPKRFPVKQLARLGLDSDGMELGLRGQHGRPDTLLIRVTNEQQGTTVECFDKIGNLIPAKETISQLHFPQKGYAADLNRDGRMDYVVEVWSGGNGLAAEICDVAFILSSQRCYRKTTVNTMSPNKEDFLDLFADGRCQFLHTAFVDGYPVRGKDGKTHNYWVYSILEVTGGSLRLSNPAQLGFPKWILYTFRANHRETDQLTDKDKLDLWRSHEDCMLWTPEDPCRRGAGAEVSRK